MTGMGALRVPAALAVWIAVLGTGACASGGVSDAFHRREVPRARDARPARDRTFVPPPEPQRPLSPAPVFQPVHGPRRAPPKGSQVQLSDADLIGVDRYVRAKYNPQWILGDEVDIVASREYFAQALTVVTPVADPRVHRTETRDRNGTLVTLTYRGPPESANVAVNPRVLIGDGLTVTARRVLRVRLIRTVDPRWPVRLRIEARGSAARGSGDDVYRREPFLVLGGDLRWWHDHYVWQPLQ
jgi:hypothetical protein